MNSNNIWYYEDNALEFASVFYIGADKLTIRTFAPTIIDDQVGDEYDPTEITSVIKSHAEPFTGFVRTNPIRWLPASFFGSEKEGKFIEIDVLTIDRNSPYLGHFNNTDHCVYLSKVSKYGLVHFPFNRTSETMTGRLFKNIIYGDHVTRTIMSLKTDFAGMTWDDAQLVVKTNPEYGVRVFLEDGSEVTPQAIPSTMDTPHEYPTLVLSAPSTIAEDAYATVSIECQMLDGTLRTDCQSEVFLEAVAGYLPKTRVKLTNGVGSFKVGSLGLTSGDTVRVKAGWRYVPGLGDASITVE